MAQDKVESSNNQGVTRGPLPASQKAYIPGKLHADIRVPVRRISQTPTPAHVPKASDGTNKKSAPTNSASAA